MKSTDIKNRTKVTKDFREKSIVVSREFDAPVEQVWRAFTNKELLDEWWGPSPWRAETKTINFTPGGYWLYAMVGPDDERQWGRMNYFNIEQYKRFEFEDAFCDENGKMNNELPVSRGEATFYMTDNGSKVDFKMMYPSESDLEKMVEMGFEEGITIGLDQLESLLRE